MRRFALPLLAGWLWLFAAALPAIADGGRDAFYRGEIAARMDAFFAANGGWLRRADFERHTSTWVDPVSVKYRGYDVHELPPNGQGIAALQMLNILEGFDLKAMGFNSPDALHVMIEAKKLAFEDRAKFYADPEFSKVPLRGLLSKEYAAQRRALIRMDRAARTYDAGNPALQEGDTIYLTTADADGNMVSFIQSNYRGMGSGVVVPGLGFGFQNRGEMFTLEAGHANDYAPGKRPFHTIIPAFVTKDGEPWLSFGLMGGAMQPQGHMQVFSRIVDYGQNPQAAIDGPRWRVHELDKTIWVEEHMPADTANGLESKGHKVTRTKAPSFDFGSSQIIWRYPEGGAYLGASESRRDGAAVGF